MGKLNFSGKRTLTNCFDYLDFQSLCLRISSIIVAVLHLISLSLRRLNLSFNFMAFVECPISCSFVWTTSCRQQRMAYSLFFTPLIPLPGGLTTKQGALGIEARAWSFASVLILGVSCTLKGSRMQMAVGFFFVKFEVTKAITIATTKTCFRWWFWLRLVEHHFDIF